MAELCPALLADETSTLIFYAPPHGIAAILKDAAEVLGGSRKCVVARELTKVRLVAGTAPLALMSRF